MMQSTNKDYPSLNQLNEEDLDENSSLIKMLHFIGREKRVIDFGCATGYFAKFLQARQCQVTGIDINPDAIEIAKNYCEKVFVADLDATLLTDFLETEYYDVAVFGDVLEHVKDPWSLLKQARLLLNPDGYVVASIPNIAHGAIRLSLLKGRFEYTDLGILDNTHLRFFTEKTIYQLFEDSGYIVADTLRTQLDFLSGSPLIPSINPNDFPSTLIELVKQERECNTLQFVVLASPSNESLTYIHRKSRLLQESLEELEVKLEQERAHLAEVQAQIHPVKNQLHEVKSELHDTQTTLYNVQTELHNAQVKLHDAQIELHACQVAQHKTLTELHESNIALHEANTSLHEANINLHTTQRDLYSTQSDLQAERLRGQKLEQHLQEIHTLISTMESSKFWKLRNLWFKFKSMLGHDV